MIEMNGRCNYVEKHAILLISHQQEVCDCFCSMVVRNEGGITFLVAPGKTSKALLISFILAKPHIVISSVGVATFKK